MRTFSQFQEEVNKKKTLEDRRKEAFERSREQLRKASIKPERPKVKPVQSGKIKSKTPRVDVAKAITSIAKSAAKRLRRR